MSDGYDVIVIGTGAAGITGAFILNRAGLRVAIVDERPFGGTCALRGCDPKKVLYGAAEIFNRYEDLARHGIFPGDPEIIWGNLMEFKETFTGSVSASREKDFKQAGIDIYHGTASFLRRDTLRVGEKELLAGHFLIASGAKPQDLNIEGEDYVLTSDDFLDLSILPEKILFIGGGYISMEFAGIAMKAGVKVTVLQSGPAILKGFDLDLVEMVQKTYREMGADIVLNTRVQSVEKVSRGFKIYSTTTGGKSVHEANLVFHGAGRVPNIDALKLENAGVKATNRGIIVNEYLQSVSCPHVYAAGDCAASGSMALTPISVIEGEVAAENILKTNSRILHFRCIPTVAFTLPPVASVGLSEREVIERKLNYKKNFGETTEWYGSRRLGIRHSGFKVLIEKNTEKILGAHLFYPNADEIINLFAIAIENGLTVERLKNTVYSYPTSSSDIRYML